MLRPKLATTLRVVLGTTRRAGAALCRDVRGTSLIETALIAPVLVLLAGGAIDAGLGYAQKIKVQQAAARSVELATVSGLVNNLQATMQADGASAAGVASGNVTIDIWLECNGVRQGDVNGTCSASAPARFASTTITDTYTPLFAAFFSGTGAAANNTLSVPLRGYASVRVQ